MPYSIVHNHPDCKKTTESGETGQYQVGGHAVVKDDDNRLMGCHKTHEAAEKQIQAILINEAKQKEENSLQEETELRQVDRRPPKFMQENAQRGLDNLNKAGDGLVDETVRQARIMAKGEQLSIDKIVKIAAWHKRHISDLDREKSKSKRSRYLACK